MLRILHTSDWHLGHSLHGIVREPEHASFLAWLLELLEAERPDALFITGDIYDTATPPARAERTFFDFLAEALRRLPDLDVVVIGGNHDSAVRLEATSELLRTLSSVHIVAGLARRPGVSLDTERLLVPLHDATGAVAAWVAAVPFLRPADLPSGAKANAIDAVHDVYDQVLAAARKKRVPGQALLATGHCTLVDTIASEGSERTIGSLGALPVTVFPDDVAFVALGHLHKAQAVGHEHVRYAGSPIPLSLTEADYVHEVRVIEIEGEAFQRSIAHPIPRAIGMLRLPADGPLPLDEVLELIAALPDAADHTGPPPFLEVRVTIDHPEPSLRRLVEEALEPKAPRLIKLNVDARGDGPTLAEQRPCAALEELDPVEVFSRCYRRRHDGEPPEDVLRAFATLLGEVRVPSATLEVAIPDVSAAPATSQGAA